MIESILVVCEGNICRSPMGQGLLRHGLPLVEVSSAGLGALVGHPADPSAIRIMHEHGVDIENHVARQITVELCSRADLILVMDARQKRAVERLSMSARGKVYRLGEAEGLDIFDPYRKDYDSFERCFATIQRGVEAWIHKVKRLS